MRTDHSLKLDMDVQLLHSWLGWFDRDPSAVSFAGLLTPIGQCVRLLHFGEELLKSVISCGSDY